MSKGGAFDIGKEVMGKDTDVTGGEFGDGGMTSEGDG